VRTGDLRLRPVLLGRLETRALPGRKEGVLQEVAMRRSLALVAPLLILPFAGCGEKSAFGQSMRMRAVKGTYAYGGRGSTVSIPWRFDAKLQLDGRGKYALDVDVEVKDDKDRDTDYGTYRVEGDKLYLDDDGNGDDHELVIRGDSLIADTGWQSSLALRLVGVPKPIFVKER
jgi:hypothetical protein